jgi:RNA polymerase sigma-70 factor (ECF subfamily)
MGATIETRSLEGVTDGELVVRLGDGDEEALRALHRRYAALVFTVAARVVDPAAAEEVVQDVFLTLWRKHATFDPSRGPLKPWLCRMTRHRAMNLARNRRRTPQASDAPFDVVAGDIADDALEPDEALWHAHRRSALRAAIDALPHEQRRALSLAYFDELTQEQIAAALHVPLGTTKTRIRLALRRLAPALAALVGLGLVVLVWRRRELEMTREEQALAMVTSSDVVVLHLRAAPGAPPATHANYRTRPGSGVSVLTASHLPVLPAGEHYVAWVHRAAGWSALGPLIVRPDGGSLLVAEGADLGADPDGVTITRERDPGAAPRGSPVAVWYAMSMP